MSDFLDGGAGVSGSGTDDGETGPASGMATVLAKKEKTIYNKSVFNIIIPDLIVRTIYNVHVY